MFNGINNINSYVKGPLNQLSLLLTLFRIQGKRLPVLLLA